MIKLFSKILFVCILILCSIDMVSATIIPITPENGSEVWEKDGEYWALNFKWENTDTSTEYVYFFSIWYESENGTKIRTALGTQMEKYRSVMPNSVTFWQVLYHPKDTYVPAPGGFLGTIDYASDVFVVGVKTHIPEDIYEKYVNKPEVIEEQEVEEVIPTQEEEEEIVQEKVEEKEDYPIIKIEEKKEVVKVKILVEKSKEVYSGEEFVWNVSNTQSVLGESTKLSDDIYVKYNRRTKQASVLGSEIRDIDIQESYAYPIFDKYSIYAKGLVPSNLHIKVDVYGCDRNFLNPRSWFACEEVFEKTLEYDVVPNVFLRVYENENHIPVRTYIQEGSGFNFLAGYPKDIGSLNLSYLYRAYIPDLGLSYEYANRIPFTPSIQNDFGENGTKPFSFPFKKHIGVTQWYGYTQYQSPHTGIDFGASKEVVLAVGDGEVVGVGWDSYFGDCLSGGKYIKIKQSNGMYTIYFHLDEIGVNTGDIVSKGQAIGVSGNTGFFNCQPLGYHLHFETRTGASFGMHVDPVEYISVDWNKILTLGYLQYPGRLSGQNPHPGF